MAAISTNSIVRLKIASPMVQTVRWRRKPRWLPTAPSKLFRVPERKILPQNENIEWLRLNNNYRTQVNSLRRYLIQEVEARKEADKAAHAPADEEAEFQRCLLINQEWNQTITAARDTRIEAENEKRREEILTNIERKKVRQQNLMQLVEQKIEKESVEAKSYITRDNIDKIIEQALANPVDYNFSIDLKGKRSNEVTEEEVAPKSP